MIFVLFVMRVVGGGSLIGRVCVSSCRCCVFRRVDVVCLCLLCTQLLF